MSILNAHRAIPLKLLNDEITLLVPTVSGYDAVEIYNVRVQQTSAVREYSSTAVRDISQITVYYDCENSSPQGVEFAAGMLIEFVGRRYEIISAAQFAAESLHHVKITARAV